MANTIGGLSEDQLQSQMVAWFDKEFPEYRRNLFHVPNGGSRDAREAMKFRSMGVKAGVADLILILLRQVHFIEVKTERGTQSEEQKTFEAMVEFCDHRYYIVRNLKQFQDTIWNIIGKLQIEGLK